MRLLRAEARLERLADYWPGVIFSQRPDGAFEFVSAKVEALTGVLIKLRSESAMSIVLVEQNSRVALAFSERTVIMSKGRIVYDGASAALRDDPERLAQLIGLAEAG